MVEAKRYLQVANLDINDINYVLQQIQDRLDQIEGYRGIPTFLQAPVGQTAGDANEIPILGQLTAIQTALNKISPPCYGEMVIDTQTDYVLTDQSTWYQITGWTAGHEDLVEFESVYDHLVLPAGDYLLVCFMSCALTGTNQEGVVGFFNDGVLIDHAKIRRMFATIDIGAIAMGAIEVIGEGSKITVWAMNDTSAGKTFTVNRATVVAMRIHK